MATKDDVETSENEMRIQDDSQNISLEHSEINTVDNVKPTDQETQQNSRKKKKSNNLKESDLLMQKAVHVLHEEEDQYDVFGKYIATELRSLSSDYLRRKLKRNFNKPY
ncbi:unnamed protein product [Acanthoscelides obtectus]|uniref:Uncharacterized protein n=1 Tax=Acanthoscelides obtectus TaxID=200917 RepID=A0A9P0LGG6_ACAOB|nr:unnamed protein product [Acanthoscelides obtectus]CAK1679497.1 hypothetical protein AOBTE_LOCUS32297 [Acanthoscelides obtectus]